ncbi:MAG: alpha-L-rhamnosidase C-terminal domain-containing protein, partial [Terriglobia bacterium]
VGDAMVESQTNYATFGDVALATKFLRQIAQGQDDKGALPDEYPAMVAIYPKRQPIGSGIPTFMAQWVSILLNHYRYTGDLQIVSELYPHMARVMGYLGQFQDNDGLLDKVPGFEFLDWVPGLIDWPGENPSALTGMNCHYYRALLDAATLAGIAGEKTQQNDWMGQAERVKRAINERLWSAEQGVYAHGRSRGQLSSKLAVHDSILAAYSGVAPPERVSQSFTNIFDKPLPGLIQIGSPYFYFFLLRALRGAGRHQQALDATRRAYGKMLKAGATTWWEVFATFGSLCHAWSSAPSSDLSGYVLGVQLTEPGYAAFRVEPHPSDLTWANGVVPTPRGDVSVNWKRENSAFELSVAVPMKSVVELSVPAKSLETTRLTSKTKPQKQVFAGGRARYWVEGPGTFRVESQVGERGVGLPLAPAGST